MVRAGEDVHTRFLILCYNNSYILHKKMTDKLYQRIFISITAVAVVALVLGVFKFKRDLNEPFTLWYNREVAEVEERRSQRLAGGAKIEPSMAELMLLDTDQDGLSDYEELY